MTVEYWEFDEVIEITACEEQDLSELFNQHEQGLIDGFAMLYPEGV